MSDRRSLKDGGAGRAARVRIDLHAAFSGPARWLIAALVTAAVVTLAWFVGRDDPVPDWISKGLVPALGWIYLVLLLVALVYWLRRRRTADKEEES
ncbi:MAG: hypothetical protein DVS81_03910 [Candidatus Accumulibacter meliphilus]|jgi:hypothetical protein|uniref:Uncharacterized protein n=1 Tax=Candidatus Accumulibacter meliphilus TaxID=2211374 RepID=A0A369XQW9_9PROT|nr:MAG: hypothetical protein DVS81_03910 [Candidatus Accumulibacter meliphilus]